jgi:hypothetical protein
MPSRLFFLIHVRETDDIVGRKLCVIIQDLISSVLALIFETPNQTTTIRATKTKAT